MSNTASRKPGRPPKPPGEKYTIVTVRMHPDDAERLRDLVPDTERAEWIRDAIRRKLARGGK